MRRLVTVTALLVATLSSAGAAGFVRSDAANMKRAIDAVCDVYNAHPALIRRVQLARVHGAGGPGTWKTSSDAAVAKLVNAGTLDADFADVYSRDGKITYAIFTRGDASGDGGGAREYCYINGGLARASMLLVDASTDEAISRTLYYDRTGVLRADTGAVVRDIAKRRNALVPTAPAGAITIVPYATPQALPFYGAYRAALAGTLPKLP